MTAEVIWRTRAGIQIPVAVSDVAERDLRPYVYCPTPLEARQHPATCGRPGTGRAGHRRHHTPVCADCRTAERTYGREQRQQHRAATAGVAR